jgi:hypothetical protein
MNDEFLTKFHKAPRAEFADALYERISRGPQPRLPGTLANKLTFRNAAIAFVFLFLIAACVYAVSEKRWNKIGGIYVEVQRTLKVDYNPEEPQQYVESECLSIVEAREILRFELHVPAWAPDGFMFDGRVCGGVDLDRTSDFAGLYWKGADEYSGISISLQDLRRFNISTQEYENVPAVVGLPVAPGSYEEVQVNGKPAVLVRGDWAEPWGTGPLNQDDEFKWDKKRGLQLHWVDGEVIYHLHTRADVSAEDLIRMAESAQ